MASSMSTFAALGSQSATRKSVNEFIQATGSSDLPSHVDIESTASLGSTSRTNPGASSATSSSTGLSSAAGASSAASAAGSDTTHANASMSISVSHPICVTLGEYRIASAECGPYTLVAQQSASSVATDTYPIALLSNLQQLISMHLGPFTRVNDEADLIVPILDLIDDLVQGFSSNLEIMFGVSRSVYIDRRIRSQLEQLLLAVEEVDQVQGSALFLGSQQLHSRMPSQLSFWVSRLLAARPMGTARTRALPLFFQGSWCTLVLTKLQHMTLALTLPIRAKFLSVLPLVQDLESILSDSDLPIPEAPPLLTTRNLTSRNVLLCALIHYPTGSGVLPLPRRAEAVSDTDNTALTSVFHTFFHRVSSIIRHGQNSIIKYSSNSYRFIAIVQTDFALYALFPEKMDELQATRACEEIIISASQQMGLNLILNPISSLSSTSSSVHFAGGSR